MMVLPYCSIHIVQYYCCIGGHLHFFLWTFKHTLCCLIFKCMNSLSIYTGQKQPIYHFAEYWIPWAVATVTNCLRFKANDGDLRSWALSDLFSSLASMLSVSGGARSHCHSAQPQPEEDCCVTARLLKGVTRLCLHLEYCLSQTRQKETKSCSQF